MSNSAAAPPIRLAVVVPTYQERDNIAVLIGRLVAVLEGISFEIIVVDDDSPDGTAQIVYEIALRDRRVRCLRRIGRRGLSSALIEGLSASGAPLLAVIDADLQHDETLLPRMVAALEGSKVDAVVATRYAKAGGADGLVGQRAAYSRWATRLARLVLRAPLSDPMSGFFMIRREVLEPVLRRLSGLGFKILLDIFASSPKPLSFTELPYHFRQRHRGESKLDSLVAWDYLMLLVDKTLGRWIPVKFIEFSLVGALGVLVHMAILWAVFAAAGVGFPLAQAIAVGGAMIGNYLLNNVLTYRDRRLSGRAFWRGLISFFGICGIGGVANVGVASYLFALDIHWVLSALAGIVVGAVWNYTLTSVHTWRRS